LIRQNTYAEWCILFMVPVLITPVNENSMTQNVVILSQADKCGRGRPKRKYVTAEFLGDNDILKINQEKN